MPKNNTQQNQKNNPENLENQTNDVSLNKNKNPKNTKDIKIKGTYFNLNDKKEKKLKYDYNEVEKIIENFLDKYEIDFKIESKIYEELERTLNKEEILVNLNVLLGKEKESEYKYQLNYEQFVDFKIYVSDLIKNCINEELTLLREANEAKEHVTEKDEEELTMYEEIYANLFEEINLTMFNHGINRITLTTFHYYLKVLEVFAKMYLDEAEVTNIRRAKNPLELFLKDLYIILSKDPELTRFLLTLKSLIEQWLIKYNAKTKIGEFYYDILMISPDYIIERILKYLLFTAIKNKNPLTLRAIFSSYLTLIHQNLFSFYATNLDKVKIGFFKQLENLFTENFNLIFENNYFNSSQFFTETLLINFIFKHKKLLKKDYFLFSDEYFQYFFEPNYIDINRSYDKNMNIKDHDFLYNTVFKHLNNSFKEETYYHKVNSKFFKNNIKKKYYLIIKEMLIQKFFNFFFLYLEDKETVNEILDKMAKDISQKLNLNFFLDENYKNKKFDEKEYYKLLDDFVEIFARKIL